MSNTVNSAFNKFMRNTVNLESQKVEIARRSRDFLKSKINSFNDFFPLYNDKNIDYGSFARKTKIRDLDDIDMIFTLKANGCTWREEYDGTVYLKSPQYLNDYNSYRHSDSLDLNSKKIVNKFISSLKSIPHYTAANIHRNMQSVSFKLDSYDWNFDIVPAFMTTEDLLGKSYYLIPDGYGNWMKTDPRIDRARVKTINKNHNGKILDAIRITKYWQRRATMPSMSSYLLESIILEYYESNSSSDFLDINFRNILNYLSQRIYSSVNDPKGIQGEINTLSLDEKIKISIKAENDVKIADTANYLEVTNKDHENAIKEWRKVFGINFPSYG
ncbi:nucleotidyltransferase [Psychrobacter sp. 78a-MNA-CIBAN-0178]|uniref:SMODS domain-containing nucleotidyltransferase n=1 Tax=Psychrobacter sp. 78a-MNA-CIBAN-0178 TaxID=3140450 RepID=UPI0033253E61